VPTPTLIVEHSDCITQRQAQLVVSCTNNSIAMCAERQPPRHGMQLMLMCWVGHATNSQRTSTPYNYTAPRSSCIAHCPLFTNYPLSVKRTHSPMTHEEPNWQPLPTTLLGSKTFKLPITVPLKVLHACSKFKEPITMAGTPSAPPELSCACGEIGLLNVDSFMHNLPQSDSVATYDV
jgi:hypothetical protein